MNKQKEKKKRFYQQKSFHITMGSIAGVILLVLLAFRVRGKKKTASHAADCRDLATPKPAKSLNR